MDPKPIDAAWYYAHDHAGHAHMPAGDTADARRRVAVAAVLTVAVALLVGWAGVTIARRSGHILIEGAPPGLSPADIACQLCKDMPGVAGVGHVHAWAFTGHRAIVTLEVDAAARACPETVRRAVKAHLREVFNVSHFTMEVRSRPRAAANTAS